MLLRILPVSAIIPRVLPTYKFTPSKKGGKTESTSFGSPGRSGHDSARFYAGRIYEGAAGTRSVEYVENALPPTAVNTIFPHSAEAMDALPDCSVHLMVTSPPYNVGKEYDANLTLEEYRDFLRRALREVYRALVPGGRLCFNIANLGRRPYLPMHRYIIEDLLELGFLMRGEIIWDKGSSAGSSTAWGSWKSASNPTLRDVHEYILALSKETWHRPKMGGRKSTISRDDFLEYTRSVWKFPADSARRVGHPAPFPVELPRRCIELYTYSGEVVLDPFMGSGSTAIAALQTGRRFVGYEISAEYRELAYRRLAAIPNLLAYSDTLGSVIAEARDSRHVTDSSADNVSAS